MARTKIKLRPQQLLLSLTVLFSVFSVINTGAVSSQTTPTVRILRVRDASGTTFKSRENWYKQSGDITNEEKCSARQGEKFFVSSIRRQIQNAPARPQGNYENISDYWEVTFEQRPPGCLQTTNNNNLTWFVYKRHVQEFKGVIVP
jgi:hypothetical protein